MSKKKFVANVGYGAAAKYLHAVYDPELKEYFSLFTGGTFKSDMIVEWRSRPNFSGLMFWFCLDNSGSVKRKLYLAVEPKYNFSYPEKLSDFEKMIWEPELKTLPTPGQFFGETIFNTSEDRKNEFLQGHTKQKFERNSTKENVEIKLDLENFKADMLLSKFQKYPFAYFANEENDNKYFDNFFKSGHVEYIRYYLGFGESYTPNKLRLILVPVGKGGKNIVKRNLLSEYLLQKSWPPPPNT